MGACLLSGSSYKKKRHARRRRRGGGRPGLIKSGTADPREKSFSTMFLNIFLADLLVLSLVSLPTTAAAVFLDYQVDSSNTNLIFLECYSDGGTTPNRDAIFEFFNPITRVLQARLSPLPSDRLMYNITPATEAVIHCFVDEVSSQNVSIAGECFMLARELAETRSSGK